MSPKAIGKVITNQETHNKDYRNYGAGKHTALRDDTTMSKGRLGQYIHEAVGNTAGTNQG